MSGAWLRAETATLLTDFDDFGLLKSLDALEATFLDVFSFFAHNEIELNYKYKDNFIIFALQVANRSRTYIMVMPY